eukprot:CCRYP_011901-RB/>CCRYP_011901-RB protein AED:0.22 eAED:0.37 QI:328/0/0.33/1/0/0/3/0/130
MVLEVSSRPTAIPAKDIDCVLECLPAEEDSILKKPTENSSNQVVESGLTPCTSSNGDARRRPILPVRGTDPASDTKESRASVMAVPAVTEHDIHVNFIEKLSTSSEWFTSWGVRKGGKVTDGGWEVTCFN